MNDKIAQIRARFEEELSSNPSAYHPIDIDRVRTEEWQVKRYLLDSNGDVDASYTALIKTLAWKKSYNLHSMKQSDFPKEIYDRYRLEIYKTKEGRMILSEAYRYQKNFGELDPTIRAIIAFQLETTDRLTDPEIGAWYLGDFTDTPVLNLDVPQAKFRVDLLNQHYPLLARKLLLINVPFMLKPVIKLIVSFMKQSIRDAVQNVNYDQLNQLIDPNLLHAEMKGKRTKKLIPAETRGLKELATSLGASVETVKQFNKYHGFE